MTVIRTWLSLSTAVLILMVGCDRQPAEVEWSHVPSAAPTQSEGTPGASGEPLPMPEPLEWEEEWLLTRMARDGDAEEWLLMKLQGLGEGAARVLNASDDRLEGLLALVDVGWKNQVVEIGREWQIRFRQR